jgi:hypothetical protein
MHDEAENTAAVNRGGVRFYSRTNFSEDLGISWR